ncbi:hypothetical protein SCLCIDRAFT_1211512 [Scleroderma citrinum Foug A]|uniref:DUF866-domain-containing protein n=1 Tax=Scleroderma citrinum Foug A TaxID=1036808 RepID=A0A0C3E0G3_9AGAM|nr:hypothetical protein SCLCIDRAFT_1211512 [Scleroderma citrinum Foug A]
MQNVTKLQPVPDFEYFFKVTCTSCHETHPKYVGLNRQDEREISGSKHATAHLVWRCGNCKRESSAKFDNAVPVRSYSDSGNFAELLVIECRGLEFSDFDPRGAWTCEGVDSGTLFDVDLPAGEMDWVDYDEKASLGVMITFEQSRWSRA